MRRKKHRFIFTNTLHGGNRFYYPYDADKQHTGGTYYTDEVQASITDPQGSWTGVPADKYDEPVQDADDL